MTTVRQRRDVPAERDAPALPLSISLPEFLVGGSDREFRRLIHRMFIGWARLETIREAVGARVGVSGTQYSMLMAVLHLQGEAGVSIGAVADYLEVTGPHVTAVIGKLASLGLVRKAVNPNDRRGVLVRLTPLGRKRLLHAFDFIRNVNDRLFAGVHRDVQKAVSDFHAIFIRNTQATLDWIDRQDADPARIPEEL